MKFDYYLLNTYVPEQDGPAPVLYEKFRQQIQAAEDHGFHTAWFTEHHFRPFGGMLPNPQVLMGHAAATTRRIRLGTAVTILPLHHPLRIAEDLAMLDVLSHGRIDVGAGRGMDELEYQMFGAEAANAHELLEEGVEVLQAAWTRDPFSWRGKHFQYSEPVSVWPSPVQRPHPPIWVTANKEPDHFRWIGRHGFNLMTLPWILPSLQHSRQLIDVYREGLREGGYDDGSRDILAMFPTHVGPTPDEARQVGEPAWLTWRGFAIGEVGGGRPGRNVDAIKRMSYQVMIDETRAIFGDPVGCVEQVGGIRDALGVTHVAGVFHFGGMAQEHVLSSMRLFGTQVAPHFQQEPVGGRSGH